MLEARRNVIEAMLSIAAMLGGDAVKTVAYYDRVLSKDVRGFYNGTMDAGAFIDDMIRLINEQLTRAWNEGMRANDLDPGRDMKPEWQAVLDGVIESELDHVLDYAEAIEKAAAEGLPVDGLLGRVKLWANRYNEVVNLSKLTTRPKDRYRWVIGSTAEHCSTCLGLNGKVASAEDWIARGYRPQGRELACGGWNCQCSLVYTEEPVTQKGPPEP